MQTWSTQDVPTRKPILWCVHEADQAASVAENRIMLASKLHKEMLECLFVDQSRDAFFWKAILTNSTVIFLQPFQVVLESIENVRAKDFSVTGGRKRRLVRATKHFSTFELMTFRVAIFHVDTPSAFFGVDPLAWPTAIAKVVERIRNWLLIQWKYILSKA
jgi:hypothetical protein